MHSHEKVYIVRFETQEDYDLFLEDRTTNACDYVSALHISFEGFLPNYRFEILDTIVNVRSFSLNINGWIAPTLCDFTSQCPNLMARLEKFTYYGGNGGHKHVNFDESPYFPKLKMLTLCYCGEFKGCITREKFPMLEEIIYSRCEANFGFADKPKISQEMCVKITAEN